MAAPPRKAVFRLQIQTPTADWPIHCGLRLFAISLIVEADGGQHTDAADYDEKRTAWLEAQGFRVLRFWNNDVLQRTDDVLDSILNALEGPR